MKLPKVKKPFIIAGAALGSLLVVGGVGAGIYVLAFKQNNHAPHGEDPKYDWKFFYNGQPYTTDEFTDFLKTKNYKFDPRGVIDDSTYAYGRKNYNFYSSSASFIANTKNQFIEVLPDETLFSTSTSNGVKTYWPATGVFNLKSQIKNYGINSEEVKNQTFIFPTTENDSIKSNYSFDGQRYVWQEYEQSEQAALDVNLLINEDDKNKNEPKPKYISKWEIYEDKNSQGQYWTANGFMKTKNLIPKDFFATMQSDTAVKLFNPSSSKTEDWIFEQNPSDKTQSVIFFGTKTEWDKSFSDHNKDFEATVNYWKKQVSTSASAGNWRIERVLEISDEISANFYEDSQAPGVVHFFTDYWVAFLNNNHTSIDDTPNTILKVDNENWIWMQYIPDFSKKRSVPGLYSLTLGNDVPLKKHYDDDKFYKAPEDNLPNSKPHYHFYESPEEVLKAERVETVDAKQGKFFDTKEQKFYADLSGTFVLPTTDDIIKSQQSNTVDSIYVYVDGTYVDVRPY